MLWKLSKKFQFAADRIIPESLVFCIILTLIVFVSAFFVTGTGAIDLAIYWYDGLWTQIGFGFQMSMMVVVCAATAKAPSVERFLKKIARLPNNRTIAMITLLIFGTVTSIINWAFSLIVTAIFAKELSKNVKGMHFPLMIAGAYSTMLLGQLWCPNSSLYALLASENHFLVDVIGVMTQDVTAFNPLNTVLFLILTGVTILVFIFTVPPKEEVISYVENVENTNEIKIGDDENQTIASKLNTSIILMLAIAVVGLVFIVHEFMVEGFIGALSLNFIIFCFLILNMFLYKTPIAFVDSFTSTMHSASQIMLQFPFYGGIMGVMASSGLASVTASIITNMSTQETLPLVAYISASLLNLFVPSQGGQWIIQGPILIESALQLNANIPAVINAFAFGDQATNLLQPLYLIPSLAVVNLKLKEVWGFCAFIWVIWTVVTCIGLAVLPVFLI